MVRHREPRHAARFNRERGEEAGVVVHAPVARHGPVGERAGRWEEGREGGREGGGGPIQMQKFWLEFWLENWLEILLEIFFTGKSPKMGSLDMLQNQKVISSQFSSQISSQNFCF